MDINNLFIKHDLVSHFHFVGITLVIWLLFLVFGNPAHPLGVTDLSFLMTTALLSLFLLTRFENFEMWRVLPRQSGAFLMIAAFLIGAYLSELMFRCLFDEPSCSSLEQGIITSIPLAIVVFGAYGYFSTPLRRSGRKKKVVLDLAPSQRSALMNVLAPLQLGDYVEYLSQADFADYAKRNLLTEIDLIVISRETSKHFDADSRLLRAHLAGVPIMEAKELTARISGHIRLSETDQSSYLLEATQKTLLHRILLRTKYMLEPLVALGMGLALLPLFLGIAILQKMFSPGPILYRQTRTGYLGKPFELVKFRSMAVDAEPDGPRWATPEDARMTGIGRFLRRSHLDELPQLWNVIRGEMSFVGPRPERPEIYKQLETEVPLFYLRTLVRPGISGWAAVCSGYAASSAESLLKLEYDLFYIQHMSLRFDLYILIKTVKIAFVGDKSAVMRSNINSPVVTSPTAVMQA